MSNWSIPMDRVVAAFRGDQMRAVRAIGLEVFTRVVMRSPVDTGRFRGNWMMEVDAIPTGVTYQGGPEGQGAANTAPATQHALEQLQKLRRYRLGSTVYVSNSLPYAPRLEEGYSAQAPLGIMRATAEEFPQIVDVAVRAGQRLTVLGG